MQATRQLLQRAWTDNLFRDALPKLPAIDGRVSKKLMPRSCALSMMANESSSVIFEPKFIVPRHKRDTFRPCGQVECIPFFLLEIFVTAGGAWSSNPVFVRAYTGTCMICLANHAGVTSLVQIFCSSIHLLQDQRDLSISEIRMPDRIKHIAKTVLQHYSYQSP